MHKLYTFTVIIVMITLTLTGNTQESLNLPDPIISNDLMKALRNRGTYRSFNPEPLSRQIVAEILWAAYGVNNSKTGRRTVATAFNMREMSIYVLTKEGGFFYNADEHALVKKTGEDIRDLIATQKYAASVPLHLIYVADYDLAKKQTPEWISGFTEQYSIMHTGQISQNVYLYCASKGLGTIVRDVVKKDVIGEKLGLQTNQKIITSQAVGYPGQ
ncbi:MAG: nitroreductase family protein [Candidatus Latescibacteria bacterium]|nr:nitroreductase family protein [Candidatus Latescibacterota bacterium]